MRRTITKQQIAGLIDHTMLKIDEKYSDIKRLCLEAQKYHFAAVAVHPVNVALAKRELKGSGIKVVAAIGFYLGVYPPELKIFEVKDAITNGADELDMVINVGALNSCQYEVLEEEVKGLVESSEGRVTKLILETELLNDNEIIKACKIASDSGIDFIKTSTGFRKEGATKYVVELIRKNISPQMGVKASGGIRTLNDALEMIEAGANRLGTSNGVAIMEELDEAFL